MNKISYALGMSIANNIKASGIENVNVEEFTNGLKAVLNKEKANLTIDEAQQLLNEYFTKLQQEQTAKLKEEGANFLKENSKKDGIITLPSGLQYRVIKQGNGKSPKPTDKVECHYVGRLINGTKFDSSYDRNETATFGVTQVIPGWVEALQLMKEGDKWELFIPYNLAYGERGAGQHIPPFSTLVFEVELIKVK